MSELAGSPERSKIFDVRPGRLSYEQEVMGMTKAEGVLKVMETQVCWVRKATRVEGVEGYCNAKAAEGKEW